MQQTATWPPDTDEISAYGGPAVADSRKMVVLQVGRWTSLKYYRLTKCNYTKCKAVSTAVQSSVCMPWKLRGM